MFEKDLNKKGEKYLIDNYGKMDMTELSYNLEKTKLELYEYVSFLRTKENKKVRYINKRWTNKEKDYLIKNYYKMNINDLCKKINKNKKQIYAYVSLLRMRYGIDIRYKPKRINKKNKGNNDAG